MKKYIFKNKKYLVYIGLLIIIIGLFRDFFSSPYNGLYLYYDDATNQVLRFYQEMWETVRVDHQIFKLWDWSNVLGANYIGSNSYYNLFSPFTLIFYLFPKDMIADLLLYQNMLKLFLIAVIAFNIAEEYSNKFSTQLVVMIVLSFNGWLFSYAKYLFMWDAYVFMLLIILGIEKFFKNNNRIILFISTMLLGIVNYYYLYMFSFIVVVYYLFRYYTLHGFSKDNLRDFFDFGLVYLLGILGSMVIFLPSILNVTLSDRLNSADNIFISFSQLLRYFSGYIAKPEIYGSFNGFLDYRFGAAGWNGGMSFYSFMITPLLLPQIIFNRKHRNLIVIYLIITVMVCILPFYSLICGSFESRWFIMIVIINSYMLSQVLDAGIDFKVLLLSIVGVAAFIFAVNWIVDLKGIQDLSKLSETTNYAYFFLLIDGTALLIWTGFKFRYLIVIMLLIELFMFNPLQNDDLSVQSWAYDASSYDRYEALDYLKDNYDMNYRTDILDIQHIVIYPQLNVLNSYNLSGFSGYHSLFNYYQNDFFDNRFKAEDSWYIFNQPYKMGLKNTLSNKYWIVNLNNDELSEINPPIAYELIYETSDGYQIYQNEYPLEIIQFKDNAISSEEFIEYSVMEQDIILRNNVVVDNSDLDYQDNISELTEYESRIDNVIEIKSGLDFHEDLTIIDEYGVYSESVEAVEGDIIYISDLPKTTTVKDYYLNSGYETLYWQQSRLDYSYIDIPVYSKVDNLIITGIRENISVYVEHDYETKLKNMYLEQQMYVNDVNIDNETVTCTIINDHDGYIVTSIPFDDGWTLKVDGLEVNIENINNGFAGAYLEAGNHEIELTYCTPGLCTGIIISTVSILVFIVLEVVRRKNENE